MLVIILFYVTYFILPALFNMYVTKYVHNISALYYIVIHTHTHAS